MSAELVVDLFVSVDGWAGGDRLPAYFGYSGPELAEWIAAEQPVPEIVVMGRRTYEAFEALPPEVWQDDRAHLMGIDKVLFSTTLRSVPWPKTRICTDLLSDVPRLKAESSVRLRTWGSMSLARQLMAAGQVDRLRLMRFPLLAGPSGRQPGFADMPSAPLELVGHRVLDGRIVLEEYRPVGTDIPRA